MLPKMKYPTTLLVFLLVVYNVSSTRDLPAAYRFSATLDPNGLYELYWNYNLTLQTISFAVRVQTTGWVGFGVSPNGQMPGSDVVIGWVDNNGRGQFDDRYAEGRYLPPIDASQDWFLVSGEEEGGYTILEFTRNLTTCDSKDLNIEADTSRVVWSWSPSDPPSPSAITQHSNQGATSLNLLGGLNEERQERNGTASFSIRNENFTIPAVDTTYWCSAFRLPPEVRQQERYVYRMSPVISSNSTQHVHHMLVYLCATLNNSHVGTGGVCGSANVNIEQCRRGVKLFGAWAIGASDFNYPENVAYPVGGQGNPEFIVLEMHYDNQQVVAGIVDSSGMEFFYTTTPPQQRAGILAVGHLVSNIMIIPPNAENFTVTSLCPGSCTRSFIPPDGITVFGNGLHTHLVGHGLVLQHFRQTDECGGLEELEPIDSNLKYDFNYQQFNILPREVKVLPGDLLQLQCFYRTAGVRNSTVTIGGESTQEEMCYSFLIYYPQIDLNFCSGLPVVPDAFLPFLRHISASDQNLLFQSFRTRDDSGVRAALNNVEWTPEVISEFQQSVLGSDVHSLCFTNIGLFQNQTSLPTAQCPYQAPDPCNSSATTPPAATPSATTPPAATPSATTPPAATPSATTPPAATPSAATHSASLHTFIYTFFAIIFGILYIM